MPAYEAKIDSFPVFMQSISDTFDNGVAVYDYPFVDGAALDYMGEKARRIQFECFFLNERYETHYAFLAHIRAGLIYELTHPKYGSLKGRISSPVVHHNERKRFAAITINFIEQRLGDEIVPDDNVVNQVETAYKNGKQEALGAFERELEAAWEYNAKALLTADVDPEMSLLAQFAALPNAVWSGLADIDRMLNVCDYYLAGVTLPADALIGAVDFGLRLPGRVVGAVSATVERIAQAARAVTGFPGRFIVNVSAALTALKDSLRRVSTDPAMGAVMERTATIAAAQAGALHVAAYYDADEQQRDAWERIMTLDAFDHEGRRVAAVPAIDLYNVGELENSLYLVRKLLQEAIDHDREHLHAHKRMAAALERHVRRIKLQRDRIVTVDTGTVTTPLHVICRDNGLPHRYLEKIMAINDIENPSFAAGEVRVYERP